MINRNTALSTAGILLVFAAGALLVVGPALFSAPRTVVGHVNSDVWAHVWGFWWINDTLSSGGSLWSIPWETRLLNYPRGGVLYFIDMLNAVLSLPLQNFVAVETAYNLLVGFEVFLLGVAGFLLGSWYSGSRFGGILSGLMLQLSPFVLGEIHNGISEVINVSWCILYIYFLMTLQRGRWRCLTAGLVLFVAFIGNWYFGLSSLIFTALYLVWKERRGLLRPWKSPFCRRLAITLVLAGLLTAPVAAAFYSSINQTDSIVKRSKIPDKRVFLNEHNLSDVLNYLRWTDYTSPNLKQKFHSDYLHLCTIGPLALILAVIGACKRKKERSFWWMVSAVFFVLSAGAYLYINNNFVRFDGGYILLPFYYLSIVFPPIALISHPHRFSIFVITAAAVFAAVGGTWFTGCFSSGKKRTVAGACLVAVLVAETLLLSPAPFPVSTARMTLPPFYEAISRGENENKALLDLPMAFDPFILNNRYFYHQITHRRPVPYTLNDPQATYVSALGSNAFTLSLHSMEYQQYQPEERTFYREELVQAGLKKLRDDGFGHIVVHLDYFEREVSLTNSVNYLTKYLGEPVAKSPGFLAFKL